MRIVPEIIKPIVAYIHSEPTNDKNKPTPLTITAPSQAQLNAHFFPPHPP